MAEQLSRDQVFLNKLTEIIRKNLGKETFDVRELANQAGMSPYSLNRRIYSVTNKTTRQFIRELRLLKAFEMLQNEEFTASEVAYKVGFSSPAYFNTCFHEYFGYPPGAVKKGGMESKNGSTSVPVGVTQNGRKPALLTLALASAGIIVVLILIYLITSDVIKNLSTNRSSSVMNTEKSIAVLPFKNLSSDTSNQYFIDGVMEEILTDLSRIHDLRVLSRTSVEQFRGGKSTTADIRTKLNVNYLVEGSGQKYGNKFILRIQMIALDNEKHIWAGSYEQEIGETSDIIKIQSQVAQSIATELKATITPEEKKLIEKTPTKSLTAHDFYVRGLHELNMLGSITDDREAAKRVEYLFGTALKYDSAYAAPYVGLANVYWIKIEKERNFAGKDVLNRYIDSMLLLANIAISLDDKLSGAYNVRGGCYYIQGNERKAVEDWNTACRYNPNDFSSYWCKGWFYESHDIIKSIENYQKAALINQGPMLPEILSRIGGDYFMAGFPLAGKESLAEALKVDGDSSRYLDNCFNYAAENQGEYAQAAEHFAMRYQNDSTDDLILLRLGFYNSLIGKHQESLKYYEKYLAGSYKRLSSNSVERRKLEANIGYAYMQNGFTNEANIYLERAIANYKRFIKSAPEHELRLYEYRLAGVYACKGDKAKAYEHLRLLGKEPCFTLNDVSLIKIDPLFNSIRAEPEFQKIVHRMEFMYQAEHERVGKWMAEQGKL